MMEDRKSTQRNWTINFTKKIQNIMGNPALTPLEKAEAIKNIGEKEDAGLDSAGELLNEKFGTGVTLSREVSRFVSEHRPRGVPGLKGIMKKVKK